jgi:hypothetical protein
LRRKSPSAGLLSFVRQSILAVIEAILTVRGQIANQMSMRIDAVRD